MKTTCGRFLKEELQKRQFSFPIVAIEELLDYLRYLSKKNILQGIHRSSHSEVFSKSCCSEQLLQNSQENVFNFLMRNVSKWSDAL